MKLRRTLGMALEKQNEEKVHEADGKIKIETNVEDRMRLKLR